MHILQKKNVRWATAVTGKCKSRSKRHWVRSPYPLPVTVIQVLIHNLLRSVRPFWQKVLLTE